MMTKLDSSGVAHDKAHNNYQYHSFKLSKTKSSLQIPPYLEHRRLMIAESEECARGSKAARKSVGDEPTGIRKAPHAPTKRPYD